MTTQVVRGVPQLLARFERTKIAGELAQHAATDQLGSQVATIAASIVAVDTGELRDSIGYSDGHVTAGTDHAFPVEYGTADDAAQPFMRPAADEADASGALETAAKIIERA